MNKFVYYINPSWAVELFFELKQKKHPLWMLFIVFRNNIFFMRNVSS